MPFTLLDELDTLRKKFKDQEENSWDGRDNQINGYLKGQGVDEAITIVRKAFSLPPTNQGE